MLKFLFVFLQGLFVVSIAYGESPLKPVKLDSPRDTLSSFMSSMNSYRNSIANNDGDANFYLNRAVRTIEQSTDVILGLEKRRKSAVYLKEVIDRVILIDLTKVPNDSSLKRWRLKDTEITIIKSQDDQYLFSRDTAERAAEFYGLVQHLPYLKGSGKGAAYRQPWVEKHVPKWAKDQTFNVFHWQWIGIFLAILSGFIVKRLVESMIGVGKHFTSKIKGEWDDELLKAAERPVGLIFATAMWFFGLQILQLEGLSKDILVVCIQVVFSVSVIWGFLNFSNVLTAFMQHKASSTDFPIDDQLVPLVRKALRLFIVVFGVLISIQNLGINVMSLLAGLGLGGLAFALAAKDTAANLFGSIMIFWDQPFKVGDWIVAGNVEGTVEEIGFRSTRIRSFYDSQISVPNSQIANFNIDNMGRRRYRRIRTNLGVCYDTPPDVLEAFLEGIKNIILANPITRKDYFHVVFSNYGASSLDIMLYFFVGTPSWADELIARQNVFLEVYKLADKLKVQFAFPTQSLHVASMPDPDQQAKVFLDNPKLKELAKSFGPQGQNSQPQGAGIFVPNHLST